jgi:hypothetical protein
VFIYFVVLTEQRRLHFRLFPLNPLNNLLLHWKSRDFLWIGFSTSSF